LFTKIFDILIKILNIIKFTKDEEPQVELKDDETEIETKIELNLDFAKINKITKTKKGNV
jgi:hypothetical protein